jgi:hypothetical protein
MQWLSSLTMDPAPLWHSNHTWQALGRLNTVSGYSLLPLCDRTVMVQESLYNLLCMTAALMDPRPTKL